MHTRTYLRECVPVVDPVTSQHQLPQERRDVTERNRRACTCRGAVGMVKKKVAERELLKHKGAAWEMYKATQSSCDMVGQG